METEPKKATRPKRKDSAKRAVFYRGVRIIPMTGKRSPIAKYIRDRLRAMPEPPQRPFS
jgi:hypothetical protein